MRLARAVLLVPLLAAAAARNATHESVAGEPIGTTAPCDACVTDALASLLEPPARICESADALEEVVVLRARASDGRAVIAGGDLFGVVLSRGGDEYFPLALVDRCDGTYAARLPCAALEAGDDYVMSALLEHSHQRQRLPRDLWYCGSQADAGNFTAWDALPYTRLASLHECVGKRVGGGAAVHVRVSRSGAGSASIAGITRAAHACWPASWAWASISRGAQWAPAAPVLVPCNVPAQLALTMRFDASFHHCVRTADPSCPTIPYVTDAPAWLAGVRVSLVGDSVTEGTFADVAHMWARMQRNAAGRPIDKDAPSVCRWRRGLRRMMPIREPPTRLAVPIARAPAAGGLGANASAGEATQLQVTLVSLKIPYRQGLANFLSRNGRRRIADAVRNHDVVVLESARHDCAARTEALPVLGEYRARARALAQQCAGLVAAEAARRRPAGGAPRVFWRTAVAPPGIAEHCNHPSNNPAIVHVANVAAANAFAAYGLGVLPQHVWGRAFFNPRFWPYDERWADVHSHEGWCSPMYTHPGLVNGWVSKALTQLTLRAATLRA
ncbi:hypothetical protein KFE25_005842 [Diacronema lutheri]|uniref:Uncharacterized protein n=1 Tax=Diacronema lutheri TaxID=2081491 RepID=A0A8J6CC09_DIALT|nr:hypothetical protein KFE25_005842 [Diacronema lutheri]